MTETQTGNGKRNARSATSDRLPPHSPEAEAGVLGCILEAPAEGLNRLAERRVQPEWFYDLRHQTVFAAMQVLHEKRDVPVDIITLQQFLKDQGKLEDVGGIPFLTTFQAAVAGPTMLPYYLDIVREKFATRRLISTCTELVGKAYEHTGPVDKLLSGAEHEIESLSGLLLEHREKHIKQVLANEVLPQLEEHYTRGKQKLRGLSTGLTYADKVVRGIRPNYYYVVAARPGDGKTSWAMNVVEHTAAQGLPVGVFTLEMTADSLATRLLFSVADVDSGAFEQGMAAKTDFDRLSEGAVKLAAQNIYLDAEPDQTIEMIAAKARRWAKDYGIKLFVLDYLQLLDDDSEKYRNDRVQALRRISKKIVSLKNKLNVPWLVLAQMNRNIETSETKRAPVLSDLKECGAIEQDADVVMFLYSPLKVELETRGEVQPEFYDIQDEDKAGKMWEHKVAIAEVMRRQGITKRDDWPRRVNASFVKNRYGPTGMAQLLFQSNRCRFKDWRDWITALGIVAKAKGERDAANPEKIEQEQTEGTEI